MYLFLGGQANRRPDTHTRHLNLPRKFSLSLMQENNSKGVFKIKQNCYCHRLSIAMLFSLRVIEMAWAQHAQPPFHKEEAIAGKALEEGDGTKVSQMFIFMHIL